MVGRISTETTSVIAYKDDPEEDAGVNIFTKNRKFAARSPNDPTMGWLNLGRCPAIARCKKKGGLGESNPRPRPCSVLYVLYSCGPEGRICCGDVEEALSDTASLSA